jgi:seryl-tRNA synthetase
VVQFSPCSMLHDGDVHLCSALQQLKDEHEPLSEQKKQLFEMAQKIGQNENESMLISSHFDGLSQICQKVTKNVESIEKRTNILFLCYNNETKNSIV